MYLKATRGNLLTSAVAETLLLHQSQYPITVSMVRRLELITTRDLYANGDNEERKRERDNEERKRESEI